MTEYGRAYEIYSPKDDEYAPEYVDMGATPIIFDADKYTISVPIASETGIAGFQSMIGSKIFKGTS